MNGKQFISDRPARDGAIGLLADYLAGRIEAKAVFEGWPEATSDEAVEKLGRQLRRFLPPGWLDAGDEPAGGQQQRDVVDRCILFLALDSPYGYGDTSGCAWVFIAPLMAVAGAGWLLLLNSFCRNPAEWAAWIAVSVVMVIAVRHMLASRPRRRSISFMTGEEWQYWPFDSQADLDLSRDQAEAARNSAPDFED